MNVGGSLGIISIRESQIRGAINSSSYENIGRSVLLTYFILGGKRDTWIRSPFRKSELARTLNKIYL